MTLPGIYKTLPELEVLGLIHPSKVLHNLPTPALCEEAVRRGEAQIAYRGPLVINTGKFTGRAVQDRYIVEEPGSVSRIGWGKINRPISEAAFSTLLARITAYFQHKDIFVQDAFAGADPEHRAPLRVITDRKSVV